MRFKRPFLLCLALFFTLAVDAFASTLRDEDLMCNSHWAIRHNAIVGTVDLNSFTFPEIKPIKEGHYDLASASGEQLQQIATSVIQPYIDKKLSITVNDKTYPIRVTKLVMSGNGAVVIWLSANNVSFGMPVNHVKIVYSLLFEETENLHSNLAAGYLSDATGDALQLVFDLSHPEFQSTFDALHTVWQFSVKRGASAAATAQKRSQEVGSSN
ncbi:MAG: hypothetical protein ABSD13_14545 [Candidatus Korobacteraceae bacterium]